LQQRAAVVGVLSRHYPIYLSREKLRVYIYRAVPIIYYYFHYAILVLITHVATFPELPNFNVYTISDNVIYWSSGNTTCDSESPCLVYC